MLYLWHILAYPIYQILSTIRHELSHAVAYWLSGWRVTEIKVLPSKVDGRFYWGYIRVEPKNHYNLNIHMALAPHYVNLISITAWLSWYLNDYPWIRSDATHTWIIITVLGLISPAVDFGYGLLKSIITNHGDFASALKIWRINKEK